MVLDRLTVAFMLGLLSCFLAGMMLLIGFRIKGIAGIKEYALGDLCIGLTFCYGAFYYPLPPSDGRMVVEVMVMTFGLSLRLNGIKAFDGQQPSLLIPLLLTTLAGINTYWWVIVDTDIRMRISTNSLIYCLISLLCVKALWVRTESRIRMAYQLTGGAYIVMALTMLLRTGDALLKSAPIDIASAAGVHGIWVLLMITGVQFCSTFGLMLMLYYRLTAALEDAAACDSLTGALNRRSFEGIADQLCRQLKKQQQPLTLIMLDVDHFKTINDRYGHPYGDHVLQHVTQTVRASIRPTDYLGRYGGEEFCVLLPNTTENDAFIIAERMRNRFVDTSLSTDNGEVVNCTFSLGICDSQHIGLNYMTMLKQADKALYYAKQSGRNKAVTVTELNEINAAVR